MECTSGNRKKCIWDAFLWFNKIVKDFKKSILWHNLGKCFIQKKKNCVVGTFFWLDGEWLELFSIHRQIEGCHLHEDPVITFWLKNGKKWNMHRWFIYSKIKNIHLEFSFYTNLNISLVWNWSKAANFRLFTDNVRRSTEKWKRTGGSQHLLKDNVKNVH